MKVHSSLIAVAMVVVVVVVVVVPAAGGQLTPSQCNSQKNNLANKCRSVIIGQNPSAECCQLVRAANVECVCPFVTTKLVAALGGAGRVISLIQSCGRPIPRNFKCGSVTTPP